MYSLPAGYEAVTGETILATQHNTPLEDLAADANAARPVVAGGTGVTSASLPDTWTLHDPSDSTKKVRFDAGSITTGTTRVVTVGDADVTLRPQAWELIETVDISSATATKDIAIPSWVRRLRVQGYFIPSTDAQSLLMRVSVSGVFNSTAGAYYLQFLRANNTTVDAVRDEATQTAFLLSPVVGNAANEGVDFELNLGEVNQARHNHLRGSAEYTDASGNTFTWVHGQRFVSTNFLDGIRFLSSSGNIAVLHAVVEGAR